MATFGEFPGVQVSTSGGGVSAVRIGSAEKVIFFGVGDLTEGSATPASVEQVTRAREADELFGQGSGLAEALQDAFGNNVNNQFTYAVHVPQYDPSSTDTEDITGLEATFQARRDDDDTDWDFLSSGETIDTAVRNVINEGETGTYVLTYADADNVSTLETNVLADRQNYKMVKGLTPNTPNGSTDYTYDFTTISTDSDADSMFEFAPVHLRSVDRAVMGGIGGQFAGAPLDEPVYSTTLNGYDEMRQRISRSEANDIRNVSIIPIKENGSISIEDNTSTSTETDWERDFWRRRIVDRVILLAKEVGESIIGEINDSQTRRAAERQIETQLSGLVRDRLLEGGSGSNFVNVLQDDADPDKVNIEIGVTPQGIAKRVEADITIDT